MERRTIRASEEQWQEIGKRADAAGLSKSAYLRAAATREGGRSDAAPIRHDLRQVVLQLARIQEVTGGDTSAAEPQLEATLRRAREVLARLLEEHERRGGGWSSEEGA